MRASVRADLTILGVGSAARPAISSKFATRHPPDDHPQASNFAERSEAGMHLPKNKSAPADGI
jgi:hypothetical protein